MIPVRRQPEYREFDKEVRQPGLRFLKANPRPSGAEFAGHNYWTRARSELRDAYKGLCAYTSRYIVDGESVDHFLPKIKFPQDAYEWDNYRLARQKINTYKGDEIDMVDPFKVQPAWFVLEFPSCLVRPGRGLDDRTAEKVERTIKILQLNDDDRLVQERCDCLMDFVNRDVTLRYLDRRYPFLVTEIRRQGLDSRRKLKRILKRRR